MEDISANLARLEIVRLRERRNAIVAGNETDTFCIPKVGQNMKIESRSVFESMGPVFHKEARLE